MKIALINSVYGIGSTGHIVEDLYHGYKNAGHDVKVLFGRGHKQNNEDILRFNSDMDIYYHAIMSRLKGGHGLYSKHVTQKMVDYLKGYNPDIIHLHNLHGYYINYQLLFEYINKSNIKVIWTLHDCWSFTGHCCHYLINKCYKWRTDCNECQHVRSYPKSYFLDNSHKNYVLKEKSFGEAKNLTIVTPSQWLAEEVKQSFLKTKSIKVINNCIDTEVFCPTTSDIKQQFNIQDKKVILGVATAWGYGKGLDRFIKLSEIITDEYKIILVGLTPKQKEKLPRNIIGLTRTNSKKQLAELYSCAAVFFNPTRQDNYPTVNIEALCCGTPIVCYTNTGGGCEIVEDNGIVLHDNSDMNMVVSAIKQCENITIDTEKIRKKYALNNYITQYVKLIQELRNIPNE